MERLYEHGLSAGCLSRVHPAGRNEFRPAEAHADFPPGLVNHSVMSAAQHDQVFDIRLTAVDPFTDMMHLAPGRCAVTPRMRATPVPRGHRPALRQADTPAFPTHIQWLARPVEHHRGDPAVTQQGTQIRGGAPATEVEHQPP